MRIISGSARGLKLVTPEGLGTRPTTDRVKEAMFNLIQSFLPCDGVLDLFAGSGALGLEALSRRCGFGVFVDDSKKALEIVKKNAEKAKLFERCEFVQKNSISYLEECEKGFGIIFLDPPYNKGFLNKAFEIIKKRKLLLPDGIIVAEREAGGEEISEKDFECIKHARYGKTTVSVYKYR